MCFSSFKRVSFVAVRYHAIPLLTQRMKVFHTNRTERVHLITQNSRIRYRDEVRLRELLEELFGKGQFEIGASAITP
jgi:hypothetical protein